MTRIFMWAIFAIFISGFLDFLEQSQVTTVNKSTVHMPKTQTMKQYIMREQHASLTETIEIYRMLEGVYPGSLNEMEQGGYISSEELLGIFGTPFSYARDEKSYRLLLPYR